MGIDLEALLAQLREQEEARGELRRLLIGDVPDLQEALVGLVRAGEHTERRLEALTEQVGALGERIDALTERVDALTERVDALAAAQQRTEERMEALADDTDGYLVVETSVTIGNEDLDRAHKRAFLLRLGGVNAVPVVAGEQISEQVSRSARRLGVWQVTDGSVVPPDDPEPQAGAA